MATRLRRLQLERIDLVDAPANPGSRVVLMKRDAVLKDAPGVATVHVDRPIGAGTTDDNLARAKRKRSPTVSKVHKSGMIQRLIGNAVMRVMKAAGQMDPDELADWAGGEDGEPVATNDGAGGVAEDAGGYAMMKAHHAELGKAIDSFGDSSKLPADHPVHKLKAQHKELGDRLAEHDAKASSLAAAKEAAAAAAGDDDMDKGALGAYGEQTGHPGLTKFFRHRVDKQFVELEKRAKAAEERAASAETIAKRERDARELDGVKVELRKFDKLGIDVEKEAPDYFAMKQSNESAYKSMLEKLSAVQARTAKADTLEQELGSSQGGTGEGTAWATIEAEAEKIVAKGDKGMTKHKAIDIVMKKRPDLVKKYYAESGQAH